MYNIDNITLADVNVNIKPDHNKQLHDCVKTITQINVKPNMQIYNLPPHNVRFYNGSQHVNFAADMFSCRHRYGDKHEASAMISGYDLICRLTGSSSTVFIMLNWAFSTSIGIKYDTVNET